MHRQRLITTIRRATLALLLPLAAIAAAPPAWQSSSGDARVPVLELYTSEGCSSCPPADRWFSALTTRPGLWDEFVPVVFHVDYWDYIGWKDRFAKPEFGDRQRRYAREGGVDVVYTPGVMLNGQEWRQWRRGDVSIPAGPGKPGKLSAVLQSGSLHVRFAPSAGDASDFVANVAVLSFDRVSDVAAGENRGRRLQTDFVVESLRTSRLAHRDGNYHGEVRDVGPVDGDGRRAIAVWIARPGSLAPLQATGGWLN